MYSLEAVISRYKVEQIVEGHHLGEPVLKVNIYIIFKCFFFLNIGEASRIFKNCYWFLAGKYKKMLKYSKKSTYSII